MKALVYAVALVAVIGSGGLTVGILWAIEAPLWALVAQAVFVAFCGVYAFRVCKALDDPACSASKVTE